MLAAFVRTPARLSSLHVFSRYSGSLASGDLRSQLTAELKNAMKAKDMMTSTTIRSVLSEVYAADKTSADSKISPSAIVLLLRKAVARRTDSVAQFNQASRPDLAEKEQQEIDLLNKFLPPLMPEGDVDHILKEILASDEFADFGSAVRKPTGKLYKAFFARVDRSRVDQDILKRRIEAALAL